MQGVPRANPVAFTRRKVDELRVVSEWIVRLFMPLFVFFCLRKASRRVTKPARVIGLLFSESIPCASAEPAQSSAERVASGNPRRRTQPVFQAKSARVPQSS